MEEVGRLPHASSRDIDDAVAAARRTFDSGVWRRMSPKDRGLRLRRLAELLDARAGELAELEARDTGKAVSYTLANDLAIAVEALEMAASRFRVLPSTTGVLAPDHVYHELVQPVGVVAELLPWNGPIWTGVQRLAAILSAGCAAVFKPSELGSLTFARIAELTVEADLPPGLVNVIYGDGRTGAELVAHDGVDAVSFTGGTETGGRILASLARSIRPVTLELGGKNALVVLDDADIEAAAHWAAIGGFANAGQVCVASSRVLVAETRHDDFVAALARHAEEIRVGDPLAVDSEMGTLVGRDHADKVWGAIELAWRDGQVVSGGRAYQDGRSVGAFVPPTVVTDLPRGHSLLRAEVFGPVVTIERFANVSDAIHAANDTRYGLSAGVFTGNVGLAWEVAAALRVGEVYVNRWFSPGVLEAPAAGQKQSGLGPVGLDSYLRRTGVFFNRGDDLSSFPAASGN
ncbi:aldehyde dehydrogenase family protein [Dactylosporangium sp. CA-233914]|uniref:aldehyde dehydrogenase family protein n=1 Tax=Dactylosporangium sp. CA-233914 TaxID=3239934 RepID=UPI003D8F6134